MKFLTAVTICIVLSAGAQANFFSDLLGSVAGVGDAFKTTFSGVVDQGKQLGSQLLSAAASQGGQLLSQAAQSLLLNVMNNLQGTAAPQPAAVKKDLNLMTQASQAVEHVKQQYASGVSNFGAIFNAALSQFKNIAANMGPMSMDELKAKVQAVVSTHKHLIDEAVQKLSNGIAQKLTEVTSQMGSKRQDQFHDLLTGTQNFLKTHTDLLNQIVSHTGDALTNTAGNLQQSVDQHFGHLGHDLTGHLQNLLQGSNQFFQHGAHSLDFLKDLLAQSMHHDQTGVATNDLKPEQ